MRAEGINEASVMHISGKRVLIIFDSIEERDHIVSSEVMSTWFERVENWKSTCGMEQHRVWLSIYGVPIHAWTNDTFERIAAIGGSMICVEEETLDPTSFERGRVLIESHSLTRVEFKVDLKVLDVVFPVRVSKVELFLRGPRVSRVVKGNRSDGSNSDSEDMMANSTANDVGNGLGRDRTVGECQGESWGAIHVAAAELLANANHKGKGRGRPRMEGEVSVRRIAPNSPSVIADISITDSDVNCRQSAILREAKAMVGLVVIIRVLSWNVRGLGAVSKRRAIQALLRKHEVEMAFFQETKLVEITDRLVKQLYGIHLNLLLHWSRMIPCCLGGDFNEVTNYVERRGCVGDRGGMLEFVGFIHDGGFVDMPAAGKVFTWYGSKAKGCRLDRFLVSTDWLDRFEGLEQRNLLRNVSDHDPVRLSCGVVNWGPRPFRFLNAWLERKGHIKWNRESFGCVETQIETVTALLNDLDNRVNELDDETICLRCKVQGDLWRFFAIGSRFGARNLGCCGFRKAIEIRVFFQCVAKIRGMQNKIRGLVIDDR
ncbi:hypothetical protein V6N13_074535 [Hibiscus sabdariffa]